MKDLNLVLSPARAAVLAGMKSTVELLVRLQAPERPASTGKPRMPLHLALVIDRSGSMSGRPLDEAKRCAQMVVDGLRADDQVAVVTYDDRVDRLTGLLNASNRDVLSRAIGEVRSGGCTNLHGGWLAGAEELAPQARTEVLSRVILLSDGLANQGLTNPDAICRQVAELAAAGVTTSTYGLGEHFNEQLMTAMSDAGRGNAYYGETADDLADPFREELALLDALCARKLELSVRAAAGVSVEVLNDYTRAADGAWRLPDLAYGGEAWALLRLTVDASAGAGRELVELVKVSARWTDLEGRAGQSAEVSLALPALPAAAYAAVAEDEAVRRRIEEVAVAGMQARARDAAQRGDWGLVMLTLEQARLQSRDNPWMQGVVGELEKLAAQRERDRFMKEATYSSRRAKTRLATPGESLNYLEDAPEFLRRKPAQGKAAPRIRGQIPDSKESGI